VRNVAMQTCVLGRTQAAVNGVNPPMGRSCIRLNAVTHTVDLLDQCRSPGIGIEVSYCGPSAMLSYLNLCGYTWASTEVRACRRMDLKPQIGVYCRSFNLPRHKIVDLSLVLKISKRALVPNAVSAGNNVDQP